MLLKNKHVINFYLIVCIFLFIYNKNSDVTKYVRSLNSH